MAREDLKPIDVIRSNLEQKRIAGMAFSQATGRPATEDELDEIIGRASLVEQESALSQQDIQGFGGAQAPLPTGPAVPPIQDPNAVVAPEFFPPGPVVSPGPTPTNSPITSIPSGFDVQQFGGARQISPDLSSPIEIQKMIRQGKAAEAQKKVMDSVSKLRKALNELGEP